MRLRRRLVEPVVLCGLVAQALLSPLAAAPIAAFAAPAASHILSRAHPRAALAHLARLPLPVATTVTTPAVTATVGPTDVQSATTTVASVLPSSAPPAASATMAPTAAPSFAATAVPSASPLPSDTPAATTPAPSASPSPNASATDTPVVTPPRPAATPLTLTGSTTPLTASAAAAFAHLPLAFEANQGQTAAPVAYLARTPGAVVFLTPQEAILALERPTTATAALRAPTVPLRGSIAQAPLTVTRDLVQLHFAHAAAAPQISGADPLPGTANYFVANDPAQWHTNIPTYGRVVYHNVYPGIDLSYYGTRGHLEYDWTVAPGTDPHAIALAVQGAQRLRLDGRGNLLMQTGGGTLTQAPPIAYQDRNGQHHLVSAQYVISGTSEVDLALGAYDPSQPLVIDPVLRYGTLLGGGGTDIGEGIAVDSAGDAYVSGSTDSSTFNGGSHSSATGQDAFVAKLNPSGTALLYSSYLGGTSDDDGWGIAVDGAGTAYVTGQSGSPNLPDTTLPNSYGYPGTDAFVAKLPTVPQSGLTWNTALTALPQALAHPAVAAGQDGIVYVFGGGATGDDIVTNTTWIYHPLTDTWTQGAPLPTAREGAQAVTLPNGEIAVLGGGAGCAYNNLCGSGTVYSQVDVYNPRTDRWNSDTIPIPNMNSPRYRFAAVLYQGKIYALGGSTKSAVTASVETYDLSNPGASWITLPSSQFLPQATEAPAALVDAQGALDVLGGYDGANSVYSSVSSYTGSGWQSKAALPQATEDASAALGPDGQVYLLGGYDQGYLSTVQVYNPWSNSWTSAAPLPATLCCTGAVSLSNGEIVALGGNAAYSWTRPTVAIGAWTAAAAGHVPWHPHQTVRLSDHLSAEIDLADGHVDVTADDLSIPARTGPGPEPYVGQPAGAAEPPKYSGGGAGLEQ